MRKQGEIIVDTRLKFRKGFQKKFISKVKKKSQKSWSELAKLLGVHIFTLRIDWYTERRTVPKKEAKKLLSIGPFEKWSIIQKRWILKELPPYWGQIKAGGKNKKKIVIPLKNPDFAEFLGCALGDGYLGRKCFTLSSDATQEQYVLYIEKLIYKLFELKARVYLSYSNKNNLLMNVYSIELVRFLEKNGLTKGDKIKGGASFPKWVFKDKNLASAALRGLFDTDGGIYEKQKGYKRAIIEFQTKSPYIHKDILMLLKTLKFKPSKGNSLLNIRVQDQNEIHKFFNIIGSSNFKNIIRYKVFLKKGYVPQRGETIQLMKNFSEKIPFKAALI